MSGTEAGTNRPSIDYEAAAQRLLVALCVFAKKYPEKPIPSGRLCRLAFGPMADAWQHETRRRRIRDAAVVARELLARGTGVPPVVRNAGVPPAVESADRAQLCANGQGYWYSGNPVIMAHYANQRRRRAIKQLAQVSTFKPAIAEAGGQATLFDPASFPPLPKSEFRH